MLGRNFRRKHRTGRRDRGSGGPATKEPGFVVIDRLKKVFRFGSGEDWSKIERRRSRFGARRRRRWVGVSVVLLTSVACAVYALGYVSGGAWDLSGASKGGSSSSGGANPAGSKPIPELPDDPAAAAYGLVASELPGIDSDSIEGVYQSKLDPSWASVRIAAPEEESIYVVFLQRENDS